MKKKNPVNPLEEAELIKKIRTPIVGLLHCIFIVLAYALSFLFRFNFSIPDYYQSILWNTLPAVLLIKILFFYYFGLLHSSIRFASIYDLWQIIKVNTIASFVCAVSVFFFYRHLAYPRSIFLLDFIFCLALIGGIRLFGRLWRDRAIFQTRSQNKKVIIVGAGDAGIMILKECRMNPAMNYHIVGFIDDASSKKNLTIQGVPVLGSRTDIPHIVEKHKIEEIIIAIPSATGQEIRTIIDSCQIPNIKIKILPGIQNMLSGDFRLALREVKPDDLLGRETVKTNKKEIAHYIQGKKVLITGAGGSIGSELSRQIVQFFPQQLILVDYNENDLYFLELDLKAQYPNVPIKVVIGDIKDIGLLKFLFSKYRPQIIFHAAAFKHVPLMEYNLSAAIQNNVIGSRNLIYAADHYQAESFILISSDKAVNPSSVMGATKRIAEMILQAKAKRSKTKLIAVRFGNVLDSKGSVVPLFRKQIEQRNPVTVTHPEVKRYFMSVREAVELVLQASTLGKGGEIFVLDMGQQIKIYDLAKSLITLYGLKPESDIPIKFIGLRPGEKLAEETLHDIEKTKITKYEKIFIAQPNNFNPYTLRKRIKHLEELARLRKDPEILRLLKELIPSYTYHNTV